MISLADINPVSINEWEIPSSYRADMRVPVRLFVSRELLQQVMRDKSLEQAVNAAALPGLVGPVMVMPDMHQGYGFPIGGVAATSVEEGVVSPGAIGYDINCGVRLLSSRLEYDRNKGSFNDLVDARDYDCARVVGKSGHLRLS